MEARYVRGKQGLQWILSGFYFFRQAPLHWILICFTYLLIGPGSSGRIRINMIKI